MAHTIDLLRPATRAELAMAHEQAQLTHFALKSKRYTQAVRVAFDALRQMNPERLAA